MRILLKNGEPWALFEKLTEPEQARRSLLLNQWRSIAGERFSRHTKPQFGKQGEVLVWVDDSTLAFELSQRYKATILKRLQNEFGADQVKKVRFMVGQIR